MMSRPSWWRWCAGRALLEIVISTYGFVADPVAWQIGVLPALACELGEEVLTSLPWLLPCSALERPCCLTLCAVPPGQSPLAGITSRPSWWRRCAGIALFDGVIFTYGFELDPVAWQIVVLPA